MEHRPSLPERRRLGTLRLAAGTGCALEGGDPGVATILGPFTVLYAGVCPSIIAPLLRWAWLRAFGNDPHPAVVTATAEAVSQRRPWRRALRM